MATEQPGSKKQPNFVILWADDVTGQFGKNHLGDHDEFLPTRHGFDEFFGNLYHLNAAQRALRADASAARVDQQILHAR
jgi:arylsulfatase A-like enzyme